MTDTVAIIPARGGSVRIPFKNTGMFHGKPMIAHSIEIAQKSGLFSAVWVSTENMRIGLMAEGYGAQWYKRKPELAEVDGAPDCGTQEVTRDVLVWLRDNGSPYKYACCIYPCAPMINIDDLWGAKQWLIYDNTPYVYTTHKWRDAGQFYFGLSEAFIDRVPLSHWATQHLKVGADSYCDINTYEDWDRAEKMYPIWKAKYASA